VYAVTVVIYSKYLKEGMLRHTLHPHSDWSLPLPVLLHLDDDVMFSLLHEGGAREEDNHNNDSGIKSSHKTYLFSSSSSSSSSHEYEEVIKEEQRERGRSRTRKENEHFRVRRGSREAEYAMSTTSSTTTTTTTTTTTATTATTTTTTTTPAPPPPPPPPQLPVNSHTTTPPPVTTNFLTHTSLRLYDVLQHDCEKFVMPYLLRVSGTLSQSDVTLTIEAPLYVQNLLPVPLTLCVTDLCTTAVLLPNVSLVAGGTQPVFLLDPSHALSMTITLPGEHENKNESERENERVKVRE
jgi:hypothetical protein